MTRHSVGTVLALGAVLLAACDSPTEVAPDPALSVIGGPPLVGELEVPQTWIVDLDEGRLASGPSRPTGDFWYEAVTSTERYIMPWWGATIALSGDDYRMSSGTCRHLLDTAGIPGPAAPSRPREGISFDLIEEGSVLCVRTNEGRLSVFEVTALRSVSPGVINMDIRFRTLAR